MVMDSLQVFLEGLLPYWWLGVLVVVLSALRRPAVKGWFGERLVRSAAQLRLPEDTYHPLHDVTLPTADGSTQIDHVFVSRYGVFVVETKNYKGWIYGRADERQWTQKLGRRSYRFQNPLRQNYKHVKSLQELLGLPDEAIHSVVTFVGDCRFKTEMPANVVRDGGFVTYIRRFTEPVLSVQEVAQVLERIERARLTPGYATNREHVRQLRQRHAGRAGSR